MMYTADKDIINLLDNMDNMDYLKNQIFKFDGTQVRIKLEGENFNSSLTGSLIIGLAQYQEKIYRIYLANKYGVNTRRKIWPEEMKRLEIKVTVNQGSTDTLVAFANNFLKGVLEKMPVDKIQPTLLGLAGIIAGSAVLIGVGSKAVKEAFKTKRELFALKKVEAKNEVEKKKFEFLESSLNTAIESLGLVCMSIIQAGPSRVFINDKIVPMSSIESVVEELALEKPEVIEQSTVIGTYRIQRVTQDFKRNFASVDIYNIETGDSLNGVIIQPKSISDGSYKVFQTAQNKQNITLRLIITKRNDRIYKAVLDEIL